MTKLLNKHVMQVLTFLLVLGIASKFAGFASVILAAYAANKVLR